MSEYKYLNELRTEELIDEIKSRLNVRISQVKIMPIPSEDELDKIVQYVGATNANYINGYFYKCVSDGGVTPAYSWEKIQVSDGGDTIQVETLPTASADELGNIYEYVGTTTANYINGRFYRCVSDGASTPTYSWEEVDFGDGTPHWSGTRAEYEAVKNTLEAGTYVSITDDYDDGLEVVDVIESGNMNPVTSNAVAEALPKATYGTEIIQISDDATLSMYWQKFGKVVVLNLLFEGIPTSGEGTISNIQIPSALRPAMRHSGQKTILNWGTLNVGCALLTSTSEMRIDYAGNSDKGSGQIVLVTD